MISSDTHEENIQDIFTFTGRHSVYANSGGTTIPDKISMLVDIGSSINLIGAANARKFEEPARRFGRTTDIMRLNKILYVN